MIAAPPKIKPVPVITPYPSPKLNKSLVLDQLKILIKTISIVNDEKSDPRPQLMLPPADKNPKMSPKDILDAKILFKIKSRLNICIHITEKENIFFHRI